MLRSPELLLPAGSLAKMHAAFDFDAVDNGWAEVEVKNRFAVGDRIEIIHPQGNTVVALDQMQSLDGDALTVPPRCRPSRMYSARCAL